MKIIKEGVLPVQRKTCDVCGCVFEYDFKDVDGAVEDNGFGRSVDFFVECPCCENTINLSDKEVHGLHTPKSEEQSEIDELRRRLDELERNKTTTA